MEDQTELTMPNRAAHPIILQHRQENHDRHGAKGDHAYPCPVCYLLVSPLERWPLTRYLLRFTKDEMQRELLENMYRTNELDDLLKESDYTIRRRKECQQMVESLSKASEIVSQVQ